MTKTKFYVALYEIFISRRVLAPSSAKYKCLGEFLLLALPNTKCCDFRYASWQVNCSALLWYTFTLLANRIQAAYYWVTA